MTNMEMDFGFAAGEKEGKTGKKKKGFMDKMKEAFDD